MVSKLNLGKMLMISFLLLFGIGSVYSATGLNLVLVEQNPDPVEPGNFVYVNVKVSNNGDTDVSGSSITFVENQYFKIAAGEDLTKELGVVTGSNSLIKKYKIAVSQNAPIGLNTLKFNVQSDVLTVGEIDILVQDTNPVLAVNDFKIESIAPGESAKLILELENTNSMILSDVVVTLGLDDVTDKVLSLNSGSNQKVLTEMAPNSKSTLEFDLVASPDADSMPYLVPVSITFSDSFGGDYSNDVSGSVLIYSKPHFALALDSQEIYSKGKGKVTLAVSNPGTSTIKGTTVEILEGEGYDVISGISQYIGNLNPDDFQTLQSEVYVSSDSGANLNVKVSYLDSYNKISSETISVPLKVYSDEEIKSLGLMGAVSNSGPGTTTYVVVLVLLLIVFFIGRKSGYKKAKLKFK